MSLLYTCAQLLVVLGKHEPQLPLMVKASTRAGNVAILSVYSAFSLFFLSGLLLTW